jgi:hypothetical protein
MWILAEYMPVTLFSLKPAAATSSGGKTLLCPTPFAIKMALLDAALRTTAYDEAVTLWPVIRDLRIKLALPPQLSVINTFTKIVRPKKNGPSDDDGTGLITPLNRTIAYREYVSFGGNLNLALQLATGDRPPEPFVAVLAQINYLGKRGGFMQLLRHPLVVDDEAIEAMHAWIVLTEEQQTFAMGGTLQVLDDCGAKLTFQRANIYSGERITQGKERILRHIVLPYRVSRSSRNFTLYERMT